VRQKAGVNSSFTGGVLARASTGHSPIPGPHPSADALISREAVAEESDWQAAAYSSTWNIAR
jgi:hypothetical protein